MPDAAAAAVATATPLDAWSIDVLLDALPDSTAILDRHGTIVAVNHVWRMFALDNGGRPDETGVGVNYLDVCARAARAGCFDAADVEAGIRAVLNGEAAEIDQEYLCPSPTTNCWFALRITPIAGLTRCVLVSHVNISRQKVAELILERRASEDPLTGLANRALFTDRLAREMTVSTGGTRGADVGLLYIDLDRFKPINDTYGHAAGDEVLQTVASRLRWQARPHDTVARLGGDEFAVIAPRMSAAGLAGLRARISLALDQPHLIHGHRVEVRASVGAHLAGPGDSVTGAVHLADQAMYAIKHDRRRAV